MIRHHLFIKYLHEGHCPFTVEIVSNYFRESNERKISILYHAISAQSGKETCLHVHLPPFHLRNRAPVSCFVKFYSLSLMVRS